MAVILDGSSLTLESAMAVAGGARVKILPPAMKRMVRFRTKLEAKIASGETVYGVNTGFGSLSSRKVGRSDIKRLQLNLIRSHAAGIGDHMPKEVVRCAMLIRLNSLINGNSGVRPEIASQLKDMLNAGVTPHVPEFGSLGASGDLVPSAHMALAMVGEGSAEYRGECMSASTALAKAGLKPIVLESKSGLSLINGTCFTNAFATKVTYNARLMLRTANSLASLTAEAVNACVQSFDPQLISMKKDRGQREVAREIRGFLKGSKRVRTDPIPQDPYSIRCAPQVHGALWDAVDFSERIAVEEMNSISDNPVITEDGSLLHGGNFHAQPLAMVLDLLAISTSYLGVISLSRIGVLLSRSPENRRYMAIKPGLESGLMILQYSATALAAENSKLIYPMSAYPANVSEGVEDHASHGVNAGLKAHAVVRNVSKILAMEMICASNFIGVGTDGLSPHSAALCREVRKATPLLKGDRSLSDEIEKVSKLIRSGRFV